MATVLQRVPVERIEVEARQIRFARTILTLFAGFFFAVGWMAGKTWAAVAWSCAAIKVGWQEARKPPGDG